MGHTTQNMTKLSHTALFLAAAVVLLAIGLPTSPKEVLESIGKADTIVPEGEAAAVEITQKAQTHNNHKDAAPKLGDLQMSRGGLNQPCKTDPSIGSFCDSVYISDTLASLEAKCVYGVDHGTVYGFDHTSAYSCNPGPAGGEKNDCYYRWMYGSCQCDVCKCVKPAPKPAPLCKFVYPCFNDMHKFDNSRYMSPDGNMCALSIVDQIAPMVYVHASARRTHDVMKRPSKQKI